MELIVSFPDGIEVPSGQLKRFDGSEMFIENWSNILLFW